MKTQRVFNIISVLFMILALGTIPALGIYELYIKPIAYDAAIKIMLVIMPVSAFVVYMLQVVVPNMIDKHKRNKKQVYYLKESEEVLTRWPDLTEEEINYN